LLLSEAAEYIKANIPVSSVVRLYGYEPDSRGFMRCPFHHDPKPSLKIYDAGGRRGWYCFGCHAGGSVIDFVMKHDVCSFPSAVKAIDHYLNLGLLSVEDFLTEENAAQLLRDCDIAVDALDNIPGRRLLAAACEKAGLPLVYGAISGWVAQAALSMPGDKLVEKLYPEDTVVRDKSVLSFTPALCASMQAALCVKYLVGRPVEAGKIRYFDLLNQEFETILMA